MVEPATDAEIEAWRKNCLGDSTFFAILARLDAERAANARLGAALRDETERCAKVAANYLSPTHRPDITTLRTEIAAAIRAGRDD